jgi:hypothetical protein
VLALLLITSLGVKLVIDAPTKFSQQYPDSDDIVGMLVKNGFKVSLPTPDSDPYWILGKRDGCRLQIANVSPQGWHRAAVEWKAAGAPVLYAAGDALHVGQPILVPLLRHYLRRMERYVGIPAPGLRVRAVIMTGKCPEELVPKAELAALSN